MVGPVRLHGWPCSLLFAVRLPLFACSPLFAVAILCRRAITTSSGKVEYRDREFPAQATGRYTLQLKRTGTRLEFSAGRAPEPLGLLHAEKIHDGKLGSPRLSTDRFSSPSLIDIRLIHLRCAAGGLSEPPASTTPASTFGWRWLLWPAGVVTLGVGAYCAWQRFRSWCRAP